MTTMTENYNGALTNLKKQLASSRFLRWWLGELSGLLPAWLCSSAPDPERFIPIPLEQANAQWSRPEGADHRELVLILPRDKVLSKTIALPLATEENLRQVLEYLLEQYTPFSPGQVYFGYTVSHRDFVQGQLTVQLVVTPRDAVDAAMRTLAMRGDEIKAVYSEEMWGEGKLVNLLPTGVRGAPSVLMQGVNPWLAAIVVLLGLSAAVVPLVIKREAVVQMLPWVERGKTAAEAVDTARRELDTRVDQHNFVLEKRKMTPTVIQALEELTRVLPDDTWVQTLDLKGKELVIQGETASSVRLIGLFEQSGVFKDASFRSPLTKGQGTGTERYQLALQIRPTAQPVVSVPQAPASLPVPSGGSVSAPAGAGSAAIGDTKQ